MNNKFKERLEKEISEKKTVSQVDLAIRSKELKAEIMKQLFKRSISNVVHYKIDLDRNLLKQKENKLKLESKLTLQQKLKSIVGVIYLDLEEKLEKARRLIDVSSKNMYFFKKKEGNQEKIYVLYGEEFNQGEVLLKNLKGDDSLIIKKEDILKNPLLLAVSTSNTPLQNLHLKFNNTGIIQIKDLFEKETSNVNTLKRN